MDASVSRETKMKNKEILNTCPLCGAQDYLHYLDCVDYTVSKETFQLYRCNDCSLVATTPRPDAKSLPAYYASDAYVSHTETKKGLINKVYLFARKLALRQKKATIGRYLQNAGILLDYGCGTGAFLEEMQKDGWKTLGIEPDESAREIATKRNPSGIMRPVELANMESNSLDLITLWHVLEHVDEPLKACEQFFRILKPGGFLFLALPNHLSNDAEKYGKYWAAYDVPRHLFHFNLLNINKISESVGFQKPAVHPMFLDAFYISWLSEKYKGSAMAPLKGFLSGLKSNQYAKSNPDRGYSSQLYVLKK